MVAGTLRFFSPETQYRRSAPVFGNCSLDVLLKYASLRDFLQTDASHPILSLGFFIERHGLVTRIASRAEAAFIFFRCASSHLLPVW